LIPAQGDSVIHSSAIHSKVPAAHSKVLAARRAATDRHAKIDHRAVIVRNTVLDNHNPQWPVVKETQAEILPPTSVHHANLTVAEVAVLAVHDQLAQPPVQQTQPPRQVMSRQPVSNLNRASGICWVLRSSSFKRSLAAARENLATSLAIGLAEGDNPEAELFQRQPIPKLVPNNRPRVANKVVAVALIAVVAVFKEVNGVVVAADNSPVDGALTKVAVAEKVSHAATKPVPTSRWFQSAIK
jgi:hypothetical protein